MKVECKEQLAEGQNTQIQSDMKEEGTLGDNTQSSQAVIAEPVKDDSSDGDWEEQVTIVMCTKYIVVMSGVTVINNPNICLLGKGLY